MTDNKRFTMKLGRFYDNGQILQTDEVLNLLNELYEKNISYENDCTRYKEETRLNFYEKINAAYNNERTNIGKSVLKQLMESL